MSRIKLADQPLPGDKITFKEGEEIMSDTVKTAGWVPTAKGGKIWTYTTQGNHLVPFDNVIKYERETQKIREQNDIEMAGPPIKVNHPMLVTAIACIEVGDYQSLNVAQYLLSRRMSELEELAINNT